MKTLIKMLIVIDGQMDIIKIGKWIPLIPFNGNVERLSKKVT